MHAGDGTGWDGWGWESHVYCMRAGMEMGMLFLGMR
jgi:hypothetical protein